MPKHNDFEKKTLCLLFKFWFQIWMSFLMSHNQSWSGDHFCLFTWNVGNVNDWEQGIADFFKHDNPNSLYKNMLALMYEM